MKPVVLGVVGAAVVAVVLGAVAVFVGPRDVAAPALDRAPAQAAGSPKASTRPDNTAPMLVEAERLLNRGDTPAAKDLYTRARAQYRRDNNAAGEAAAAFGLGKLEHFNGQSEAARAAFTEALGLFARAGDAGGQARVEVAYGDLEKDTFRGAQAVQRYRAARALWAAAPEPRSDPHVLLNLDRAAQMPAGEARARAVIEQADKIFHNIGDVEGEGDVAMTLGALEMNLGNPGPAHAAFQAASARYAEAGLAAKGFDAVLRAAGAQIDQGFNIDAAAQLASASASALARDDTMGMARIALVTGDLERLQGRLPEARDQFARAVALLQPIGHPDEAAAHWRQGQVLAAIGRTESAAEELRAAMAQGEARGRQRIAAAAGLDLGLLAGRDASARPLLSAALERFRAAGDVLGEARALLALAELADATEADASRAGDAFARAGVAFGGVLAALARGDAAAAAGRSDIAAVAYGDAEAARASLTSPVAAAGRFLGLAQTQILYFFMSGEEPESGNPPDPAIVAMAAGIRARNLAAFPNMQIEARALLDRTDARLAAAAGYVRRGN